MKLSRREFIRSAGKALGALGIASLFGLPKATRKYDFIPNPLPGGMFSENNTPIGIVTGINGQTVTIKPLSGYDTLGAGDKLEYHGPASCEQGGIWIDSTQYNSFFEAVSAARPGDTIKLVNGTFYTTDVLIPLEVSIEARNSTLIGEKGRALMFKL